MYNVIVNITMMMMMMMTMTMTMTKPTPTPTPTQKILRRGKLTKMVLKIKIKVMMTKRENSSFSLVMTFNEEFIEQEFLNCYT